MNVNLESWMYDNRKILDSSVLNEIIIPGTHDSGASTIDFSTTARLT